jgi:hypothetical protein
MPKFTNLNELYNSLSIDAKSSFDMFCEVAEKIYFPIKQRLFAGQLAFYLEDTLKETFQRSPVILISLYDKHDNVFVSKNEQYQLKLKGTKLTKKNTLQIDYISPIDYNVLTDLFKESLY